MKCSACTGESHRVLETWGRDGAIRRRRRCETCGHRWTTVEREETADQVVVDRGAVEASLAGLQAILNRG